MRQFLMYGGLYLLLALPHVSLALNPPTPTQKQPSALTKADTSRVDRLVALSNEEEVYVAALQHGDQALALARKINYVRGIAHAQLALGRAYSGLNNYEKSTQYLASASDGFTALGDSLGMARTLSQLGWVHTQRGDYATAFDLGRQSLRMAEKLNDQPLIWSTLAHLGVLHSLLGDYTPALEYLTAAMDQYDQANDVKNICRTLNSLGELYRMQGDPEKAADFYDKSIRVSAALENPRFRAEAESNLAAVQTEQGQHQQAIETAHGALRILLAEGNYEVIAWSQIVMARAQLGANRPDSAVYYGQRGWNLSRQIGFKEVIRDASRILAQAYSRQNDFRQAYQYQQAYFAYNDTLSGVQTRQQLAVLQQNVKAAEQQATAALQAEEDRRQQILLKFLVGGLLMLLIVAYVLLRNNRQKQRSNALLQQQRDEIETKRDQTSRALTDLKAAQHQLIQQEKLASLGELTAGIAHEIQNPLNFVNNFSDVSTELVGELKEEVVAGNYADAMALADDLTQNLQKITQHGQRASSIVKGMLEHSRTSTGERQPTDLNALADEYLQLAYQGFRRSAGRTPGGPAKDKNFNAELVTDFAADLGKVDVVPPEIGRVLLNLYNNAFYAVSQKEKLGVEGYKPTVTVCTRFLESDLPNRPDRATSLAQSTGLGRDNGVIEIRVHDNGTGIPDAVKAKIFQPFFTTKPTGEGTGLGLSLAYDIVTKGHGGTLTVESKPGAFTEFTLHFSAGPVP